MSALEDQTILRETATEVLASHGLVLEEVEIRRGGGTPQVRLSVDLPEDQLGSADLDTVAEASRALSEAVDADDAVLGSAPVLLEVTTPGVDRELTAPRHFRRARGRLLSLTTDEGTTLRARLLAVDGAALALRQAPGRARVEVEFDPPADLEELLAEITGADAAPASRTATDPGPGDSPGPTAATDHPAATKES